MPRLKDLDPSKLSLEFPHGLFAVADQLKDIQRFVEYLELPSPEQFAHLGNKEKMKFVLEATTLGKEALDRLRILDQLFLGVSSPDLVDQVTKIPQ